MQGHLLDVHLKGVLSLPARKRIPDSMGASLYLHQIYYLAHCPDHLPLQFCIMHSQTYIRSWIGDLLEFIVKYIWTQVNVKKSNPWYTVYLCPLLPFFAGGVQLVCQRIAGLVTIQKGGEKGKNFLNECVVLYITSG